MDVALFLGTYVSVLIPTVNSSFNNFSARRKILKYMKLNACGENYFLNFSVAVV